MKNHITDFRESTQRDIKVGTIERIYLDQILECADELSKYHSFNFIKIRVIEKGYKIPEKFMYGMQNRWYYHLQLCHKLRAIDMDLLTAILIIDFVQNEKDNTCYAEYCDLANNITISFDRLKKSLGKSSNHRADYCYEHLGEIWREWNDIEENFNTISNLFVF